MGYSAMTDEQLMELLASGKVDAFDVIFDRYSKSVEYYFFSMLWKDRELSADFSQELFIKVVENAEKFNPDCSFKTWLFSMANNMCKNEYRKQEVRTRVAKELPFLQEQTKLNGGDTKQDREIFQHALERALEGESPQKRSAFVLKYIQEMPLQEISEILDQPIGTIKSGLHYTCKKLSKQLNAFRP